MGKKLDALLGRSFKTSKFKTLSKLAISRTAILSNQHQIRMSHARSDVKQLLFLGHQDRAMLRVEHVIKEQNMNDVLSMVEFYCHLLAERVKLIAQNQECPEELKEAASSLIYAASRCGEFPELQKIREVLTSRFGRDFAARAVELRNNCGVNSKIVQKFSTRRPSFEIRSKVLNEIASECGITINLEEDAPLSSSKSLQEEKLEVNQKQEETKPLKTANSENNLLVHYTPLFENIKELEELSESMKCRRKYTDVAAAAQEAFESAAHAAAAAKAAVELSMRESMEKNRHEDCYRTDNREGTGLDFDVSSESKTLMITNFADSAETEDLDNRPSLERVHPVEGLSAGLEGKEGIRDESCDINLREEEEEEEEEKETELLAKKLSDSSLDSNNEDKRLSNASRDDDLADEDSANLSFKSAK